MWVVMVKMNEKSKWCAHGPFPNFTEARAYDHGLVGVGWDRQIVRLVEPWKSNQPPPQEPKE
jgi:hypothetical protein